MWRDRWSIQNKEYEYEIRMPVITFVRLYCNRSYLKPLKINLKSFSPSQPRCYYDITERLFSLVANHTVCSYLYQVIL
jgi:hypothetical protein